MGDLDLFLFIPRSKVTDYIPVFFAYYKLDSCCWVKVPLLTCKGTDESGDSGLGSLLYVITESLNTMPVELKRQLTHSAISVYFKCRSLYRHVLNSVFCCTRVMQLLT
jgi:hypothetical protein